MLGDETLDLGKITIPVYNLAAKEDHIAPARSVFNGAKLFGGEMRYVMGGSGHIAGVINPPGPKPKYQYWTGRTALRRLRGLGGQGGGDPRLLVAGLGLLDRRPGAGKGSRPRARRRKGPDARQTPPAIRPRQGLTPAVIFRGAVLRRLSCPN